MCAVALTKPKADQAAPNVRFLRLAASQLAGAVTPPGKCPSPDICCRGEALRRSGLGCGCPSFGLLAKLRPARFPLPQVYFFFDCHRELGQLAAFICEPQVLRSREIHSKSLWPRHGVSSGRSSSGAQISDTQDKQLENADRCHQHRDDHAVVIEPMQAMHLHLLPKCSEHAMHVSESVERRYDRANLETPLHLLSMISLFFSRCGLIATLAGHR